MNGDTLTASGAEGLTLAGSLRDNGDSFQFGADTTISFKVSGTCTVIITGHSEQYGVFDIYVNGAIQTLTPAGGVYTLEVSEAATIEIKTSDASYSYIKGISVAF